MAYEYTMRLTEFPDSQNRNSDIHTKTLFGQTIRENPVPVWTADKTHNPSENVSQCHDYGHLVIIPGTHRQAMRKNVVDEVLEEPIPWNLVVNQ